MFREGEGAREAKKRNHLIFLYGYKKREKVTRI
jgi:hypothetical protein